MKTEAEKSNFPESDEIVETEELENDVSLELEQHGLHETDEEVLDSSREVEEVKLKRRRSTKQEDYDIKQWKPYVISLLKQGVKGRFKTAFPSSGAGGEEGMEEGLTSAGEEGMEEGLTSAGEEQKAGNADEMPKVEDFVIPDILIWDYLHAFPGIIETGRCPVKGCGEGLVVQPVMKNIFMRILYDFDEPILLVTGWIRCKTTSQTRHRFLGYDPRVLKLLPEPDKVPFVLFHKVGLTRELFSSIMTQVSSGVKFNHIQETVRNNYIRSHYEREQRYGNAIKEYKKTHETCEPKQFPGVWLKGFRNTFVAQCFLLGFKDKEYFYKLSMSQVTAEEWIKIDGFTLPTNVGTNTKGVWKKEMKGVFYVENEIGQIMTWVLFQRDEFDELKQTLLLIKERQRQVGKELKGCSTERCCEWRDELMEIFGPNFNVRNDVDLAIDIVTTNLPVEHLQSMDCLQDLKLVFQDSIDINEENQALDTPRLNILKNNFETFLDKWTDACSDENQPVLTSSTLNALYKIKYHIMRGCFSEIPSLPNCVRRDEFQAKLKSRLINGRLGIPVTVAISSIAFHEHNTERRQELGRETTPVFFVVSEERQGESNEVKMNASENSSLQCTTVEIDISKALETVASSHTNVARQEKKTANDLLLAAEQVLSLKSKESNVQDHNYETQNEDIGEHIIKRALMSLRFHECFHNIQPNMKFNEKLIPFLSCAFPLIQQESYSVEEQDVIHQNLDKVLKQFENLKVIYSVEAINTQDMDSVKQFFIGVAINIKYFLDLKNTNQSYATFQDFLKELKLTNNMETTEIASLLENEVKKRLSIESKNKAGSSPDDKSNESEFDLNVKETATVLGTVLVLLTSMENFPVIPVFPQKLAVFSPSLYFICRGGRLFPVIWGKPEDQNEKRYGLRLFEDAKGKFVVRCRCGRGSTSTEKGKCYTHENASYITRCLCYRMQLQCTANCECRNCVNPFGKRPPKHPPKKQRTRQVHHHQGLSKDLTADNFQTGPGLDVSLYKWSTAEQFLFESLITELREEEESLTTDLVAQKLNDVIQVASSVPGLESLVGLKTPSQVQERLREREQDVQSYLQMYQAQLDHMTEKIA